MLLPAMTTVENRELLGQIKLSPSQRSKPTTRNRKKAITSLTSHFHSPKYILITDGTRLAICWMVTKAQ